MEPSHHFNETLKRLEPTRETLCGFCHQRHSEKMDRNHFTPLYNIRNSTNILIYSSVSYQKVPIGIPRCNHCYVIHKESLFKSRVICILSMIVLTVSGFFIFGLNGIWGIFACMFLPLTIRPLANALIKSKGILTTKEASVKDPLIQEMVIAGWSMNRPSAA